MGSPPSISVVIATYNGWTLLRPCLESVVPQLRPRDDVIVVDNGSVDGTVERLRRDFPACRVIDFARNRGFAAANNAGIAASTGDIVVTLNNDTLACLGLMEAIRSRFAADGAEGRLGAIATTMLFATRPDLVASAGIEVYQNGLALDRAVGAARASLSGPVEVFGPSAGAAAYRRAALDDAGWFPESFFMYLEDVDLAWRLRLRGWTTLHLPDAAVVHAYSASSVEGSPFKRRLLARNRLWVLARCLPSGLWRRHRRQVLTYDLLALGYAATRGDMASIRGRAEGLAGLRARLGERERVQRRSRIEGNSLELLIRSAPPARRLVELRRAAGQLATRSAGSA
jgi:GT2 family glycosyltransferase